MKHRNYEVMKHDSNYFVLKIKNLKILQIIVYVAHLSSNE